jgi:hypothetical protein
MENYELDCISKYHIVQDYCGFNNGPLVEEGSSIPDNSSCIRLSVMGRASGLTVKTNTPYSKVTFKVNGHIRSEVTSDKDGISTLDSSINFDRIHCAQIESDANILNFSLSR